MQFFGANILVLDPATPFLTRLIQSTLSKYILIPLLAYLVIQPPSIPHIAGLLMTPLSATDILILPPPPKTYLSTQHLQSGGLLLKVRLQVMPPAPLQACFEHQGLPLHQETYRAAITRVLQLAACHGYQDRRMLDILSNEIFNATAILIVDLRIPYHRKIRIYMRDTLIRPCRIRSLQEAHSSRR